MIDYVFPHQDSIAGSVERAFETDFWEVKFTENVTAPGTVE